jgi:hypothetical protein
VLTDDQYTTTIKVNDVGAPSLLGVRYLLLTWKQMCLYSSIPEVRIYGKVLLRSHRSIFSEYSVSSGLSLQGE